MSFLLERMRNFQCPDSVSFNALQELLAIAPIVENEINEAGIVSEAIGQDTLGHTECCMTGQKNSRYLSKTAVDRITQEHTSRSNELHAQAMWIVYDKVCCHPSLIRIRFHLTYSCSSMQDAIETPLEQLKGRNLAIGK